LGFAVSGRAGHHSYLQRLAVDPALHGRGIGSALTMDALRWARRHRCDSMLVNTHVENSAALGLYRSLGFEELAYGLAVLEWNAS
jgi:ribosomal protein S18 acetylase RimI-like enzyme